MEWTQQGHNWDKICRGSHTALNIASPREAFSNGRPQSSTQGLFSSGACPPSTRPSGAPPPPCFRHAANGLTPARNRPPSSPARKPPEPSGVMADRRAGVEAASASNAGSRESSAAGPRSSPTFASGADWVSPYFAHPKAPALPEAPRAKRHFASTSGSAAPERSPPPARPRELTAVRRLIEQDASVVEQALPVRRAPEAPEFAARARNTSKELVDALGVVSAASPRSEAVSSTVPRRNAREEVELIRWHGMRRQDSEFNFAQGDSRRFVQGLVCDARSASQPAFRPLPPSPADDESEREALLAHFSLSRRTEDLVRARLVDPAASWGALRDERAARSAACSPKTSSRCSTPSSARGAGVTPGAAGFASARDCARASDRIFEPRHSQAQPLSTSASVGTLPRASNDVFVRTLSDVVSNAFEPQQRQRANFAPQVPASRMSTRASTADQDSRADSVATEDERRTKATGDDGRRLPPPTMHHVPQVGRSESGTTTPSSSSARGSLMDPAECEAMLAHFCMGRRTANHVRSRLVDGKPPPRSSASRGQSPRDTASPSPRWRSTSSRSGLTPVRHRQDSARRAGYESSQRRPEHEASRGTAAQTCAGDFPSTIALGGARSQANDV